MRDPPLVVVLAQVRFPTILSVNDQAHIAKFQESIRGDFPHYANTIGGEPGVQPVAGGVQIALPSPMHHFTSESGWTVSLCQDFMSLSTNTPSAYKSRDDFVGRLKSVTESLRNHLNPGRVNRLGVRFVDRVSGEDEEMRNLDKFIHADFLGPDMSRHVPGGHPQIVSRALLPAREGKIIAHWGFLAPNEKIATLDTVEALPYSCWVLDLDIFTSESSIDFDPDAISQKTGEFADRIYAVFRHVFLPEFILKRGGTL